MRRFYTPQLCRKRLNDNADSTARYTLLEKGHFQQLNNFLATCTVYKCILTVHSTKILLQHVAN